MIFQKSSILITILAVAAADNTVNAAGGQQQVLNNSEQRERRQLDSNDGGQVLVINTNKYGFEQHEIEANLCGGHLSSVHTDQELSEIKSMFDEYVTELPGNAHSLYLGLKYVGGSTDSDTNDFESSLWAWTDGTPLVYENWDDQAQFATDLTDGYAVRGKCKNNECKFSPIPGSFLLPAVYHLPGDYMDITKYGNCDITTLYE